MTEPRQIRTLATLDLNEPATVARMKLPEAEVSRLSDLGMRIGSTVRVLQASEGEPLLVAVGDGNKQGFALGSLKNTHSAADSHAEIGKA